MADTAIHASAHETAGVSGRRIVRVAAVLAATLVAVALAAAGVMQWLHHRTARAVPEADATRRAVPSVEFGPHGGRRSGEAASVGGTYKTPAAMPFPPPQPHPSADLSALRREKAALLEGYRWLDRDRGIVQIPIERAMALLVERDAAASARNAATRPEATR